MFDFLIATDVCSDSSNLFFIFKIARWAIRIIQITVPFVLIIWGSIDFFKAVIAGDEKEMKQKRKPFVQRVVAAIIIVLLPTLVNLILKNVAKTSNSNWVNCWNAADPFSSPNIDLPETDDGSLDGGTVEN